MKYMTKKIVFSTREPVQIIDITGDVKKVFEESGVKEGTVSLITQHTTTALNINEKEERLQEDMLVFLRKFVPKDVDYKHNSVSEDGRPNADAHLMNMFMNASETIPVSEGKMQLGRWQSIFFMELDGPRDERVVVVQVMGE